MKAVENEAALEIQNESKQQHLKEVNEARNEMTQKGYTMKYEI